MPVLSLFTVIWLPVQHSGNMLRLINVVTLC